MLLKVLHTIFFYIAATVAFFIGTFLTLPFVLLKKEKHNAFHFSAIAWAKTLMFLSGAKVKVSGIENVPKDGGLIFASNHQGALDILVHLAYLPRYFRFVAKSSLFKIPFFGWYMSLAGYVPIDRDISKSAHRTIAGVADVLNSGDCVLIYPEGTRSKTGELGPFKRGSLMAAFQSGASVVPVAISGSYNMMPKKSYIINIVPVSIRFGAPISFAKYKDVKPERNDYEVELNRLREEIERLLAIRD